MEVAIFRKCGVLNGRDLLSSKHNQQPSLHTDASKKTGPMLINTL